MVVVFVVVVVGVGAVVGGSGLLAGLGVDLVLEGGDCVFECGDFTR